MNKRRVTKNEALRIIIDLTQERELTLKELLGKTRISKGSLHRFLVKFKKEGKIGYKPRSKQDGVGYEEVYFPPTIMRIRTLLTEEFSETKIVDKDYISEALPVLLRTRYDIGIDGNDESFQEDVKKIIKDLNFTLIE